jgi:ribonucleoside-diphosphate reductase alpha chain
MKVQKRDNTYEDVSFDKVIRRLKNLSSDLGIDVVEIAQKVCGRIFDGVKTSQLDELAAQMCSSMVVDHPDYGTLAARIAISNHQKNTSPSFSETIQLLNFRGIVSTELFQTVMNHKEKLNSYIDYTRDFFYDYFGFKTLEKSYLLKIDGITVERPQHMWMRVSLGIHGADIKDALETYDFMSKKFFTHATPTLFNAGTPRAQCSSCYLHAMKDDSITGIFASMADCAQISKYSGGIGMHIHNIRAKGSYIQGTNGTSEGIVPMLRIFNNMARYVNQSRGRSGSIAIYLEPWHADVMEFMDLRKNHGNEEDRCRDLFLALWVPDLFMKRVQEDGVWSLMCPHLCPGLSDVFGKDFEDLYTKYEKNNMFVRQVRAQELWFKVLESQIETGVPYLLFKDTVNKKNNQKNLGTIKSSNLCVAYETRILTDKGFFPIGMLATSLHHQNARVNVWNGHEFSSVRVLQTGVLQPLVTVEFSNGSSLRCTPYHKFYIEHGNHVLVCEARNLTTGMKIINFTTPTLKSSIFDNIPHPYTQGMYAGSDEDNAIYLYWTKDHLLKFLNHTYVSHGHDGCVLAGINTDTMQHKSFVPINYSFRTKKSWLEGFVDAVGQLEDGNLVLNCANNNMSREVFYLLQTLGTSSVYNNETVTIDARGVNHLVSIGVAPHHVALEIDPSIPTWSVNDSVTITGVHNNQEIGDTYCFYEPKRNMGIFNGVLTSQCIEIMEYSSPEETAVCNLASIGLPRFVNEDTRKFDFAFLHKITKTITKNLNKIIDRNFYPLENARKSNLKHRPIGIGVQGLADTFALLRIPFVSKEAKELNKMIFETIYHAALEASMEIAKKRHEDSEYKDTNTNEYDPLPGSRYPGAYSSFEGCPASQGVLQFDMWSVTPSDMYDWNTLKEQIKTYGTRNSLLVAPMPTASTAQILGNTESFEPFTSNMFKRKTMSGEFIVINKYLLKDLINLNVWTSEMKELLILEDGSIQNIPGIPEETKQLYKTVWEMKQKDLIDMCIDRGAFIDQSQSMNVFMEDPDFKKLTSMHFYSWKNGLKCGLYYLRTRPRTNTQKFTIDPLLKKANKTKTVVCTDDVCTMCSS